MPSLQASSGEEDSAFMRKKKVLKNNSKHEKRSGNGTDSRFPISCGFRPAKVAFSHLLWVTEPRWG